MNVIRFVFSFASELPFLLKKIFNCLPHKNLEVKFFSIDYPGEFKGSYLTIKFIISNFIFIKFPGTTPKFKSGEIVLNTKFIEFPYILTIQGLFNRKKIIIYKKQEKFSINKVTRPATSITQVNLQSHNISTNVNYKLLHQNLKCKSYQELKIKTSNIKINLPTYERE